MCNHQVKTPLSSRVANLVLIDTFNVLSRVLSIIFYLRESCSLPMSTSVWQASRSLHGKAGCILRQSLRVLKEFITLIIGLGRSTFYSLGQATSQTLCRNETPFLQWFSEGVELNVCDNAVLPSVYRSQLLLPPQVMYCCQSICDFFVIRTIFAIVMLPVQIGRDLISDDEGYMSITNLSRSLFGVSDVLSGFKYQLTEEPTCCPVCHSQWKSGWCVVDTRGRW